MGEPMVADVRAQVMLSLFTDFEQFTTFNPAEHHAQAVETMLDQAVHSSGALKPLRKDDPPVPASSNMPPRGPRVGGSF